MIEAGNILLMRLRSIGDILFTLPAVNLVRDNFPDARLSYLTSKEHAPILRGFAEVNEVVTLDRALYRRKNLREICSATFDLVRRLRQARFSLVVDFQGYGETGLLAWLTGASQSWGSVYRAGRAWAYTSAMSRNDNIHPADWNLSLLQQGGLRSGPARNEFRLPSDALQAALRFFAEHSLDPARPTLFIQPFSSALHKNWPLEKFLALASHARAAGLQVVFGGGPADKTALEPAQSSGFAVSAGVPLLTTAGLMSLAQVVVGADTGLVHLAVALGKRVVMLIHEISPGWPFPYQHPQWALTPRQAQPLSSISVEEVIGASDQAISETVASRSPSVAGQI